MSGKEILNRHEWNIAHAGTDTHVLVGAHSDRGYLCWDRVALLDLPEYLARIGADECVRFGPWPDRLMTAPSADDREKESAKIDEIVNRHLSLIYQETARLRSLKT